MARRVLILSIVMAIAFATAGCRPSLPAAGTRGSAPVDPDVTRIASLRQQVATFEQAIRAGGVEVATETVSYTPSSAHDPVVRALADRVQVLSWSLEGGDVHNRREPRADIKDGTYMAFLQRVSAETTPAIVVLDFVTDQSVPWATKEDRERSSWARWVGWNKFKHPQTFKVSRRAAVLDYGDGPYSIKAANLRKLEASWKRWGGTGTDSYKCWVTVRRASDGHPEIWAIWPWERDSWGVVR